MPIPAVVASFNKQKNLPISEISEANAVKDRLKGCLDSDAVSGRVVTNVMRIVKE